MTNDGGSHGGRLFLLLLLLLWLLLRGLAGSSPSPRRLLAVPDQEVADCAFLFWLFVCFFAVVVIARFFLFFPSSSMLGVGVMMRRQDRKLALA